MNVYFKITVGIENSGTTHSTLAEAMRWVDAKNPTWDCCVWMVERTGKDTANITLAASYVCGLWHIPDRISNEMRCVTYGAEFPPHAAYGSFHMRDDELFELKYSCAGGGISWVQVK